MIHEGDYRKNKRKCRGFMNEECNATHTKQRMVVIVEGQNVKES